MFDTIQHLDIMASTRQRNQPNAPKRCKGANKMNKSEILETLEASLFIDYKAQYEAHFGGDSKSKARAIASAQGKVDLAHVLLGGGYYHAIKDMAQNTELLAAQAVM